MTWLGLTHIRSLLEQSCTVENCQDLERIQKSALKIILKESYRTYEHALNILDLENLYDRREYLCLKFAQMCVTNEKMKHLFQENIKTHPMKTRFENEFEVNHAHTERLKNSPVLHMQRLLNSSCAQMCTFHYRRLPEVPL